MKTDRALIIFTRNPELGKGKRRLAASVGDIEALKIYKDLIQHTANVSAKVDADRFVFYSENIQENDIWDNSKFNKKLQVGNDLGERMGNAFQKLFLKKYKKVIIVGSDLFDLTAKLIENAFQQLEENDAVIGPAKDGGYYLLGMKNLNRNVFKNKDWGTETVLEKTTHDFKNQKLELLSTLNDIDYLEDLEPYDNYSYLFK